MLPKSLRLSVEDFPRKSNTAFRGAYFTLKTAPGEGLVAVLIGKGNVKKAFIRNSIKRLIYNFFRENKAKGSINLLVVLNTSIMKLDSNNKEALREELQKALKEINK